jgi:hypothetical protein
MPFIAQEQISEAPQVTSGEHAPAERRASIRVPLHWTVFLAGRGLSHPLRAETRDISSSGFYCYLHDPLTPGERLECDIAVPTHARRNGGAVRFLRCRIQVVRVEKSDQGEGYGLACRIEDFCIIHNKSNGLPPATG